MPMGNHFWTTDPNGELLPKPEWHLEGEACRVFATQSTEGLIPLYRWFNSKRGLHFWTTDPNGELLPKPEWHLEGPACHVFPGDYQNTNAVPFFRFYKSKNNSAQDNGTDWCVTIYSYWNHPTRGPIQNIITRETINANNQAEAHLKAHKAFQKYPSANGYSLSPGAC